MVRYFGEVNKNTEVQENGIFEITYEDELEKIIIKTSKPFKLGSILLQNKREIRETITEIENNKIQVKNDIHCNNVAEETTEIYQFENDNIIEIKDSETKIDVTIDKTQWSNHTQNKVNFIAKLVANDAKYNLFRNPIVEIKLPEEVDKVILGDVSLLYDNGLNVQNTEVIEQENGKVIRIQLIGNQQEYFTDSIVEGTNILIPATIIIKDDIENLETNITWTYANEIGENRENQKGEQKVNIESIMAKQIVTEEPQVANFGINEIEAQAKNYTDELEVKTEAVLGDKILNDGDTVHEKQIIKYGVSITNHSSEKITGINIEGQVPEGTTYATVDIGTYLIENYEYKKQENVKTYTMPITEIEAGETKTAFYEVVVEELDGNREKNISNTITTKINDTIYQEETKNNIIKEAELEVFVKSYIGRDARNSFFYYVDVTNLTDKEIKNVKIESNKLQKELSLEESTFYDKEGSYYDEDGVQHLIPVGEIKEENKYVASIDTMKPGQTRTIVIRMLANNFDDKVNECPLSMTLHVSTDDTETYISNQNRRMSYPEYVTATQTLNREGEKVSPGETVEYKYVIKNESKVKTVVNITDKYSEFLEDVTLQYDAYHIIVSDPATRVESDTFYDLEEEQNVQYERVAEEINVSELENHNEFNTSMIIPAGKTLEITVTATAIDVDETTEIENYMVVSGKMIKTTSTNLSKFYILVEKEEDPDYDEPDDDSNDDIGGEIPGENNPDDPNDADSEGNHNITGMVWIDKNEDGIKQSEEETIQNVSVTLYDANTNTSQQNTKTTDNGKYQFNNIPKGNYLVLFEYDTGSYTPTKFTPYGSNTNSSHAMKKTVAINGQERTVGITDIIKMDRSDVENLNMGLVANSRFDLKLDKYINQITVKNDKTKTYQYQNEKLAKIEIAAKQIDKTQVQIEYKIVVTNEGNVTAYVDEVIDYVSQDLQVSAATNHGWKKDAKGNLVNTSLVGEKIQPGESKELKLTVTKKMTSQNTGTIINTAEINASKSVQNLKDVDSVAGNRKAGEDDYSEANVIISIKTGLVRNIILFILGIGFVSLLILGMKKVKNKKIFTFILLMTLVISTSSMVSALNIWGEHSPFSADDGRFYYCMEPGKSQCAAPGVWHLYEKYDEEIQAISSKTIKSPVKVTSSEPGKRNDTKSANQGKEIYEGFKFNLNGTFDSYEVTVTYIPQGGTKRISRNASATNEKTNSDKKGGTFNIQAPKNAKEISVSLKITIENAITTETVENVTEYYKCTAVGGGTHSSYHCKDGPGFVQKMSTTNTRTTSTNENKVINKTFNIETSDKGKLRVIKTDKATGELLLPSGNSNTKFKIYQQNEDGSNKKYFKYVDSSKNKDVTLVDEESQAETFAISNYGYKNFTNISLEDDVEYYLEETESQVGYEKPDEPFELSISSQDVADLTLQKRATNYLLSRSVVKNAMVKSSKCTDNKGKFDKDKYRSYIYKRITGKNANADVKKELREKVTLTNPPTNNEIKKLIYYIFDNHTSDDDSIDVDEMIETLEKDFKVSISSSIEAKAKAYRAGYSPNVIPNQKNTGWLQIKKTDADTQEALQGVVFKIYGKNKEGEDISKEETTNEHGMILVELPIGTYTVEEIKAPDGYILDYQVTKYENVNITINRTQDKPYTIDWKNKRYVDLSGYVWEDIAYLGGEEAKENNSGSGLWKDNEQDIKDKRLEGIKVQLIDATGQEEPKEVTTNSNGEYQFKKVEVVRLENYYIEFEYNGMSYQNVAVNTNKSNGSKGSEGGNRETFNNGYETITYGKSNQHNLSYDRNLEEHESKLLYGDKTKYNYGYDENKESRDPVSNVDSQYIIKANTKNAYGGNLNKICSADDIRKSNITEIKDINLGIKKRPKIDLDVEKDIYSVKVSINGIEHIYKHDERFINAVEYNKDKKEKWYDISPKVKYESEDRYGNMSYTRGVYASDIYYNGEGDESKKLKVEVTYHIGVVNNTGDGITTTVNEFIDYYDEKYEDIKVENIGKEVNKDGTVKKDDNTTITNLGTQGKYKKVKINTNLEVENQKQVENQKRSDLYIQLQVTPNQIVKLVNQGKKIVKLDSIVEINSYSTKTKDGKVYAAIDTDSEPGNININDKKTYEDDNGRAPGLQIVLQDERKITGIVFKDDTGNEELQQGVIRQGDGIYDKERENGIQNVKVQLIKADNTSEVVKKYNKPYKEESELDLVETTTDKDGKFTLSGFIPDNYQVVYTWGGKTYKVQEYKSTTVNKVSYEAKNNDLEWYKDNVDINESDAIDDYSKRQEIDGQSKIMTNENKEIINEYDEESQLERNRLDNKHKCIHA